MAEFVPLGYERRQDGGLKPISEKNVAMAVVIHALQHWGQSIEERLQAWKDAFDFMQLQASIAVADQGTTPYYSFDGADAERAKAFVDEVRQRFPMGQTELGLDMVAECLDKHKSH